MYLITAHLNPQCSIELRRQFVQHGFQIYLTNHITGQMERIEHENVIPLNIEHYTYCCMANLDHYPEPAIHDLLQRPEVLRRRIEDL